MNETRIVVLKERRLSRELKNLDFFSPSIKRWERQGPSPVAQDDNISKLIGYAKVSCRKRRKKGWFQTRPDKPSCTIITTPDFERGQNLRSR